MQLKMTWNIHALKYSSVPIKGTGTFINIDKKFSDFPIAQPLFYCFIDAYTFIWSCTAIWYNIVCIRIKQFKVYIF